MKLNSKFGFSILVVCAVFSRQIIAHGNQQNTSVNIPTELFDGDLYLAASRLV